jgi:hypothetical protein
VLDLDLFALPLILFTHAALPHPVFAVKLRRDRVVVVLSTKVYVYRFSDLKLIDQISTVTNPRGLISLCPDPSNNVLAIPGNLRLHSTVILSDCCHRCLYSQSFYYTC